MLIYHLPNHSVCCIRDFSKENTWYFLNDGNDPVVIEGRVPEIYREKVELLFYCKESIKDEGFVYNDPSDGPLPPLPTATPLADKGGDVL